LKASTKNHARPFCGQGSIPGNYSGKLFYFNLARQPRLSVVEAVFLFGSVNDSARDLR
jgi:hypothetical protein